jgi:ubiquitin carboxyl-terminal hydrolase 36/42
MRGGRQEDAHEFMRFFVDALQRSALPLSKQKPDPKLAESTWVHQIFGGTLRSRVKCRECGHPSDTFDSILDLSIDVFGTSSLREALHKFVKLDILKGTDSYKCERCRRPVVAEKGFTIYSAPAVLTIHLKRFTPMGRKLTHPVRFDQTLDLKPYMSEGKVGAPSITRAL